MPYRLCSCLDASFVFCSHFTPSPHPQRACQLLASPLLALGLKPFSRRFTSAAWTRVSPTQARRRCGSWPRSMLVPAFALSWGYTKPCARARRTGTHASRGNQRARYVSCGRDTLYFSHKNCSSSIRLRNTNVSPAQLPSLLNSKPSSSTSGPALRTRWRTYTTRDVRTRLF